MSAPPFVFESPPFLIPLCKDAYSSYLTYDSRPLSGQMAAYAGPLISWPSPEEALEIFSYEEEALSVPRTRCFPVPSLVGSEFVASGEAEISSGLSQHLSERLGGISFQVESTENLCGPLRKYGFLHTDVLAPADLTTGKPMAIEMYAEVVERSGQPAPDWFKQLSGQLMEFDREPAPPDEELHFQIQVATYANVRYPGLGIPFYL